MHGPVAFIVLGYPRSSETFIAQEILGLEKRGLDIRIYTLYGPRDWEVQTIHEEIRAPVMALPERLRNEPKRVFRAFISQLAKPKFFKALRVCLQEFIIAPKFEKFRRFGQALVLANELPKEVGHLHAHFLHTPATVTRLTAYLTGRPWSCSAHATDIWTLDDREKSAKLGDLDWLVTCTSVGSQHLRELTPDPAKVSLVYHGIDLKRFPRPPDNHQFRDGSDPGDPVRMLSVGRAVEKKGFDILLEALAHLPGDIHWRWTHIGAGKRLVALQKQARALGLDDAITWLGERRQDDVIDQCRTSDLFILPSRIAENGDRDGLPNVLLEAQSQGLACLSTFVSAIPELIEDGVTGRLVRPGDAAALAEAMAGLIHDPALRQRLGKAGQNRVAAEFGCERGLAKLAQCFGLGKSGTTAV